MNSWAENKIMRVCKFCGGWATQKHHKFRNSRKNKKIYGKLLDAQFNLEDACADCNSSHANIPQWAIWSEDQFRNEAIRRGYKLPNGKKSFQNKERFRK